MSTVAQLAPAELSLPVGGAEVEGDLLLPQAARGVVLFAHCSGSSRHSPRNRRVAAKLTDAGLRTLTVDLLTPAEEQRDLLTGEHRFDVGRLSRRLVGAIDCLRADLASALPIGLLGASTGAAAALVAAASRPQDVGAVVCRSGRPDLAGPVLPRVRASTLLIVGGADPIVVDLNEQAFQVVPAEKRLAVIQGATHLFEEPGALEAIASLAADWFMQHLDGKEGDDGSR